MAVGWERLDSCVALEAPESVEACLASLSGEFMGADLLSRWVCESEASLQSIAMGLGLLLVRAPPESFLGTIDEIQAGCTRLQEAPVWIQVLLRARERDPEWCARVADHVSPQTLFGAASEGPVQAAEAFLDDARIRVILEDGARGYFGGSPDQMHRAALIVVVNPLDAEHRDAFLGSLLDSPTTTSDGKMGCLLAQFLATGQGRGDPAKAASMLERCLQDERFALDASHQLIRYFDDSPPGGLDPDRWRAILRMAKNIAGVEDGDE